MDGAFADLPGVHLWYVDSGGGDVPVVFLHANTGTSESWENQIGFFASAGYRAIAFNRRGSGNSVATEDGSEQPGSWSEDLDALVELLALPRFHLVAVAAGSFTGLDYAAWKPARLRSLAANATMAQLDENEIRQFFERIRIDSLQSAASHANLELSAGYRGRDPEGTKRWIEIESHAHHQGAPNQPLRAPNSYERLRTITTPVLSLSGGADLISPPALMRIWTAQVPDLEFGILPEAGHSVAWEEPDLFNSLVLEFIRRHD